MAIFSVHNQAVWLGVICLKQTTVYSTVQYCTLLIGSSTLNESEIAHITNCVVYHTDFERQTVVLYGTVVLAS